MSRRSIFKRLAAKADVRKWIIEQKSIPCTDCKVQYPYYVMQFDHVRGKKRFTISSGYLTRSKEAVEAEVAKCEVVCSNCHTERTHSRRKLKSK
jgi:hypothetical protein